VSDALIAIALGEASSVDVERAIRERFDGARVDWLDRGALRRTPWRVLLKLVTRHYANAVLVAPDLDQQRLELTSLVLAVPRAHHRWRLDLGGRVEPFSVRAHLGHTLPKLVRHLLACAIALALGWPVLTLLNNLIRPRTMKPRRPRTLLYLRSQLWLGLEGGGSVAHTAGVIRGLQSAGVSVRVVSSDRLPGVDAPVSVERPTVWFDGLLQEAEDLAYNIAFFGRVWKQARSNMLYQRHTTFNCVGAVVSRLLRVPLVLEFNSSEVWKGRHWGGLRLKRLAALVERINLRAADRVVVVSEPLRAQVLAAGVAPENVLVNPNGVDPAWFQPAAGGAEIRQRFGLGSSVVVGFSGTFGVWHGVPTLAESIPRVLAARPHVRFLLVGDGTLRHLVEPTAASGRVHLPGMVPHAVMPEYLAACDILVSPHGRQADGGEFFGSPTKLFEYMAAGRAIVASGVGQIADVLEDEVSALLVPPDDPEALTNAILRLVDEPPLRAALARAGRQRAVDRHSWRHNADRLLASFDAR